MTRQKKELIRRIYEIEAFIGADSELGCGFAPSGFYSPLEEEVYRLQEELAHLSHYPDADSMFYDTRGCTGVPFVW